MQDIPKIPINSETTPFLCSIIDAYENEHLTLNKLAKKFHFPLISMVYTLASVYYYFGENEKAKDMLSSWLSKYPNQEMQTLLLKILMSSTNLNKSSFIRGVEEWYSSYRNMDSNSDGLSVDSNIRTAKNHSTLNIGFLIENFSWFSCEFSLIPLLRELQKYDCDITVFSLGLQINMVNIFNSNGLKHVCFAIPTLDYVSETINESNLDILIMVNEYFSSEIYTKAILANLVPVKIHWGRGYNVLPCILQSVSYGFLPHNINNEQLLNKNNINYSFENNIVQCFGFSSLVPVVSTPGLTHKKFTFCSYNRIQNISDETIDMWVSLIEKATSSRLIFRASSATNECFMRRVKKSAKKFEVSMDRFIFQETLETDKILHSFHDVDVCLNAFPVGTDDFTAAALWVGVPTMTLAQSGVVNMTNCSSILIEAELTHFIANSKDEYIERCLYLEKNIEELNHLRLSMRNRIKSTISFSPDKFGVNFYKSCLNAFNNYEKSKEGIYKG